MSFKEKAKAIRDVIDMDVNADNIDELQGKLMKLVNLVGLSSELKAVAKRDLLVAQAEALSGMDEKLPLTLLKMKVDGETADQESRLVYADRLNAGITHAIDSLRTLISLRKSEMEQSLKS
jgi:hypothetical protein